MHFHPAECVYGVSMYYQLLTMLQACIIITVHALAMLQACIWCEHVLTVNALTMLQACTIIIVEFLTRYVRHLTRSRYLEENPCLGFMSRFLWD